MQACVIGTIKNSLNGIQSRMSEVMDMPPLAYKVFAVGLPTLLFYSILFHGVYKEPIIGNHIHNVHILIPTVFFMGTIVYLLNPINQIKAFEPLIEFIKSNSIELMDWENSLSHKVTALFNAILHRSLKYLAGAHILLACAYLLAYRLNYIPKQGLPSYIMGAAFFTLIMGIAHLMAMNHDFGAELIDEIKLKCLN